MASQAWNQHYSNLQGMLNRNPVQRNLPFIVQPKIAVPDIASQVMEEPMWGGGEGAPNEGGGRGGAGSGGRGFGLDGAAPNIMALSQAMDINPAIGRLASTGIGLAAPGVGMALSGLNLAGNVANTMSNVNALADHGARPSMMSQIGGMLGNNALAGRYTGALDYARTEQIPGFAGLSPAQMPGDITGTSYAGGMADLAAAMDAANTSAGTAYEGQGPGQAALGGVEQEPLGDLSFQQGGYTGAGADGVVQPKRKAGIVHEGEFVIPAPMLRGLLKTRR